MRLLVIADRGPSAPTGTVASKTWALMGASDALLDPYDFGA